MNVWWCKQCKRANTMSRPCFNCGAAYKLTWKCSCGHINKNKRNTCKKCGKTRQGVEKSRKVAHYLLATEDNRGQSIYDGLRKISGFFARERGLPSQVAEEAFSVSLLKILENIETYNEELGSFWAWSKQIVLNSLINIEIADRTRSAATVEVDAIQEELISGSAWDILLPEQEPLEYDTSEQMIEKERIRMLRRIAYRSMGKFSKLIDGEHVEIPFYEACLAAFKEAEHGWIERATNIAGWTRNTTYARQEHARKEFRIWQQREQRRATFLASQIGGGTM